MTKRNYPHIRLDLQGNNHNYYGAYESNDDNAKRGYILRVATTKGLKDTCECPAWTHGKPCYHLIRAKELEVVLLA